MAIKIQYVNYPSVYSEIYTGAWAKLTIYINELTARGFEVEAGSLYISENDRSDKGFLFIFRKIYNLFFSRLFFEPKKLIMNIVQIIRIQKRVNINKPDVIFERLENYYFAAALVAKQNRLPLVIEIDAPVVYEYKTFYGRKNFHLPYLAEWIEKYNLMQADAIFCISEEMKKYYVAKGIDSGKIVVTPNGCDPNRFFPQPRNKDLENEFKLKNKIVIGWVGSLFGWSGIENLVKLVKELIMCNSNVSFLFIGGGENKPYFENELSNEVQSGHVNIPGNIPNQRINDYLSCIDIALAPYPKLDFWYASSMKVFEYMGAGKAVVVSNVGQLNTVIQHNKNGLLYEAGNFLDLKNKVQTLIDNKNLRLQLGKQARQDVLDKYTWGKISSIMAAKIVKAINEKKQACSQH